MFELDRAANRLHHAGHLFDPASRGWTTGPAPAGAEPLDPEQALRWLQTLSGHPLRAPVGVIGPNEATAAVLAAAEAAGAGLARSGLTLLCGGRQGVMEAACRGASQAGGLSIALLPGADPATANPHAGIVLASGIGEARNALIAQASQCLIAVGDSYGTLSEVALGLRLGKTVFGLAGAAAVDGVRHLAGTADLPQALAAHLLGVPDR
ncbi:hypothetical protein AZL_a10290 (plasmid) [Azospirillum sp. B510]|uniref:SLOG cluster 4 domain-containing protein n=1 Tax=Azospirillum sp. (strain B510) TaxID=137722 RepID=UPI0001C4BCE5|nr:hypothetical protein [Azospirillum sp. B510]BAI74560.1 hypothetical protein AZL_a10290 [Azospirillum sp. B510]